METTEQILEWMDSLRNQKNIAGMKRVGIETSKAFGVNTPTLIAKAKDLKKSAAASGQAHLLALELWATGWHEARILATMLADVKLFTPELIDAWCEDFDSWAICDQACLKLFRDSEFADQKIYEWAARDEEFIKRAAFALIATCAVSDKKSGDERFTPYLELIVEASTDDRNFVMKAVNWALRQIGKRNYGLWQMALLTAEELMLTKSKAARWIGSDATRELTSEKVVARLKV